MNDQILKDQIATSKPMKSSEYWGRKADQHWEMAGLAKQDGDEKDCARHTELAKEYEKMARP